MKATAMPAAPGAAPPATTAVVGGRARLALFALAVTALGLVAAGATHLALARGPARLATLDHRVWVVAVVFTVIGARVAHQQSRNPVGWLLLAVGFSAALTVFSEGFEDAGAGMAWLGTWVWWPSYGLLPLILLLFPDGRLPSPRWRPWAVAAAAGVAVPALFLALASAVRPDDLFSGRGSAQGPALALVRVALAGMVATGVSGIAGVAALAGHWRRARGDERQQLKWLFAAGGVSIAAAFLEALWDAPGAWLVGAIALPVAVGVAVLRYRLYGIDPIINRSLVYGALTAGAIALYILVVTLLSRLFELSGTPASLVATAVVAVAFQPLRGRLQRAVNRLLYGERDEPYTVLSRLGRRLEATLAPEAVLPSVTETIAQALKLPYVAIEVNLASGFELAATTGDPVEEPLRLPLVYRGETVGRLVLCPRAKGETFSAADLRLFSDLARQAGVALHAVRLTADLQRSRERLVTALEEERRRLRRELHDGLGPTLSGIVLQFGGVKTMLRRDPEAAAALLDRLRDAAQAAIADIRRLAYELRPPQLDELGLIGAVREHAAILTSAVPGGESGNGQLTVMVEAPDELPPLPAAVEVAAYRIVTEALANAVRHAKARTCRVRLTVDNALDLEIRDDGRGLPSPYRAGVGLPSMRERAAELGGTCTVEVPPDGGTSVRARLPVMVLKEE
jgi:signal transduction histidine kinase